MTVQGFTDLGSTSADNLLAGEFPRVSKLVTVTGGKYERGTILSKSESNYTICSADPEAGLYDLSDDEAKRLASLNFAEILGKNQNQNNNAKAKTGADNAKPNENGSGQPVQSAGTTGQVSK